MNETFRKNLESLINSHSAENGSDTPDFVLARFLDSVLTAFDVATIERTNWYGRDGNKAPTKPQPVLTLEDVRKEIKDYIDKNSDHCSSCPLNQVPEVDEDDDNEEELNIQQTIAKAMGDDEQFFLWFIQALQYNKKGQYTKTRRLLNGLFHRLEREYGVEL